MKPIDCARRGRNFQSVLFSVKPTDLATFTTIAALLAAATLLAGLVPAHRANAWIRSLLCAMNDGRGIMTGFYAGSPLSSGWTSSLPLVFLAIR